MARDFVTLLKSGGVGVMMTDTLYGLVGLALNVETVERIYRIRGRDRSKPCIVLISDLSDLDKFGVILTDSDRQILDQIWPDQVSVVLPCLLPKFEYLHCGSKTLAFRLPGNDLLRGILRQTGPLLAPSANVQGQKPAKTIEEAKAYFADQIDFYEDAGELNSLPSTLISIKDGKISVLRSGASKIMLR